MRGASRRFFTNRQPPLCSMGSVETAKLHAAGANELSPKVAGTSRANFRISRPLRRVRRPRPTAAEVPRRRHDGPIGQTYGGLRFIPIGLWNGDLLNYPPLTAKCRCPDGPRALPRMKTEDWRNIAGREQRVPPDKAKKASSYGRVRRKPRKPTGEGGKRKGERRHERWL